MSSNHSCSVLILFSLLLLLILDSASLTSLSSCPTYCGKLDLPYPFGFGEGCYLDKGYEIECKNVSGEDVPFLSASSKEVVNISLPSEYSNGSLVIKSPITTSNEEVFASLLNLTGLRNTQWFQEKPYALLELEWSFRTTNLSFITSLGCTNRLEYTDNLSCTCENTTGSGIIYASCACTKGYIGNPYLLGGCKGKIFSFF